MCIIMEDIKIIKDDIIKLQQYAQLNATKLKQTRRLKYKCEFYRVQRILHQLTTELAELESSIGLNERQQCNTPASNGGSSGLPNNDAVSIKLVLIPLQQFSINNAHNLRSASNKESCRNSQ